MSEKLTADDVRRLMRQVDEMQVRLTDLSKTVETLKAPASPVQPKVQKILVTNALSTGVAFGIGFVLGPILLAVILLLAGAFSTVAPAV